MANTVPVLNYTNTFGDLLSAQNRAAIELNNIAANNYTKDSGTLFLNGSGTGLSVTNGGLFGSAVVLGTIASGGSISTQSSVFVNGSGNALEVANNSLLRGNTITNQLSSNTLVRTTTLNVLGNVFANDVTSNTLIRTNTLNAQGNVFVSTLRSNGTIFAVSANISGVTITNAFVSNTSIGGSTLTISSSTITNDLQSNNNINTASIFSNLGYINSLQANSSVNTALIVATNSIANTITANTITINSKLDANSAPTAWFNNLQTTGQVSVGGNFVINGTTVYNTNTFTINAGSAVGQISSFNVNRGSSGANAAIRWNESQGYWDIRDVNNSTNFSKILTANLISNSLTSTSTDTFASSLAANTLNNTLQANVNSINASIAIVQGVDNTQNTNILALNNYAVTGFARANTSANTFIGTSGSANSTNGITTFTSTNGITIVGSANTLTFNTPQDLRTTGSVTFNSLSLTNPLALQYGGTNATSAAGALTNLLPTASGIPAGYVLATNGPGTYYWAAGGTGGGGGAVPGTTIQSTRLFPTVNAGQTLFTTPTYIPGASQLRVYINGVRQFNSEYTETSNSSVTLTTGASSGDIIMLEVDGYINNPYYANNITFTAPFGGIVSTANTIQLAIQDLETRKAALAGASFSGLVTGITVDTNASNTAMATTAFVKNSLNNSNTYTHSISGNAGTVTNGVYTNGSYADPSWITSLGGSKITGNISGNAGNITAYTINQSVGTGNNVQFNSLGVGTAGSGTTGEIRATNNITAYYSDDRLKTRLGNIENALDKLMTLSGFYYEANETAQALGYQKLKEVGVSAQEVQAVLPEVVVPAPIDDKYLTVRYEKIIPLLIEAIKELKVEIDELKGNNK